MKAIQFTFAKSQDLKLIIQLLNNCALPSEDIGNHLDHVLLAKRNGSIIGCVGLEVLGKTGLLRSLAVKPQNRGKGLAKALCRQILTHAYEQGIESLYLLTTTATGFFRKLGFKKIDRRKAPVAVQQTREFKNLCPVTAELMMQALASLIRYYSKGSLGLRPDVPGATMWSVALDKTMLTYFEVKPNCQFDRHAHKSEQITLVLRGSLFFELENSEIIEVRAGEVIAIPSGLPHAVFTRQQKVGAVDAWSPVMKKYNKE